MKMIDGLFLSFDEVFDIFGFLMKMEKMGVDPW
jgi:hypothetical protein